MTSAIRTIEDFVNNLKHDHSAHLGRWRRIEKELLSLHNRVIVDVPKVNAKLLYSEGDSDLKIFFGDSHVIDSIISVRCESKPPNTCAPVPNLHQDGFWRVWPRPFRYRFKPDYTSIWKDCISDSDHITACYDSKLFSLGSTDGVIEYIRSYVAAITVLLNSVYAQTPEDKERYFE